MIQKVQSPASVFRIERCPDLSTILEVRAAFRVCLYYFASLAVCLTTASGQGVNTNDLVIYLEAENTTSREPSAFYNWTNGATVPGFSGSGYVQLSAKPYVANGELKTPGNTESTATALGINVSARALMRSNSDQHYWSFVAPADGAYTFRVLQRPRDYVVTAYSPTGSVYGTYGSGSTEDTRWAADLQGGQRIYFSVAVGAGGYSETQAYSVLVTPPDYGAKLKYTVNFPEAGEYSVFLRGYTKQGREIPIRADLDGVNSLYQRSTGVSVSYGQGVAPQVSELSDPALLRRVPTEISPIHYDEWFWHASRLGSGGGFRVYIWVPTAGNHELSVRLNENSRPEDGFFLDRICLSRNPNFSPYFTNDFWEKQSIYQIVTDRFCDGDPSNNNATDGTVLFEPNPPVAGQQVKITYLPSARNLGTAQQVNLHRGQDGWNSVVSQPMTRAGSSWTANFTVPVGAQELNFVFNDGGNNWDNNSYSNWNVAVGSPVATVSPDPPVAGKAVTITYNSAGRNLASAQSVGVHLGYNEWGQDVSTRVMASSGSGLWSYTYEVPLAATNLTFVFNNGLGTWDSNGGRDWKPAVVSAAQNATRRQGGDFKGIEMKLDYIKAMGFTAIWMSPVLINGRGDYHGYAATDFYRIDPRFGTLEDLKRLVREAHKRGILVINDVVVNHGSTLLSSAEAGWPDYRLQGYALTNNSGGIAYAPPFDAASVQQNFGNANLANIFNNYGTIGNWSDPLQVVKGSLVGLDDFRTESSYVRQKMKEIYSYWIREVGFDGFRIDTVKHVEMSFWDDWTPAMRAAARANGQQNFLQFGEVYSGSDAECGSYTQGQKLDSVVDFPRYYQIASVFARKGGTSQLAGRFSSSNVGSYSASAARQLVTFIDNHDVPRFLSPEAGGDTRGLEMALAYLFTAPGIPSVYYGTEQDFKGGADPANRESMFEEDKFDMTSPRFKLTAKLNYIRRLLLVRPWQPLGDGEVSAGARPARSTLVSQTSSGPGLFVASTWPRQRDYYDEAILCLNTSDSEQIIQTNSALVSVLGSQETFSSTPDRVPARGFKLLVAQISSIGRRGLPPSVENVTPSHSAQAVSRSSTIKIKFDKPMDKASVEAAFSTTPPSEGTFTWNTDGSEMTYAPSTPWLARASYQITVAATACDASGQVYTRSSYPGAPITWSAELNLPLIYEAPFISSFSTGSSLDPTAPNASVATVRELSATTARLSGSVGAGGAQTTHWFEYGTSVSYGNSTASISAGSSFSSMGISADLAGLQPATVYNCRLVASNSLGVSYGPNSTFRTTAAFASATTGGFTSLSTSSVSLAGAFSLQGPSTTYFFEYGFDPDGLTNATAPVAVGAEQLTGDGLAQIANLLPDTAYFYRIVTVAGSATNRGALQAFRTLPVKPTFSELFIDGISTNSAVASASVKPNGSATEAWFEYSTDGTNWTAGAKQSIPTINSNGLVINADLAGLLPAQSYFYRGVASNANGTTYTDPANFSAALLKPIASTGTAEAPAAGTLRATGAINPMGTAAGYWIEYEPAPTNLKMATKSTASSYQFSTRRLASDDAESYQALSYAAPDNNGGAGFGAFTDPYAGTQVGSLALVTNDRRIDGGKSFAVSAGVPRGGHTGYRPVPDAEQFGIFNVSLRFDVDNTAAFSGLNLKSAPSLEFQVAELVSIGMAPFDGVVGGNSQVVVSDLNGRRGIDFGKNVDLRGEILDVKIEFDCKTGDATVSVKRRSEGSYRTLAAALKSSGENVKVAALGYLNANGSGASGQNLILDNLRLTTFPSAGNAVGASSVNVDLSGLSEGTQYNYRVVAYGLSGMGYGATVSGFAGQTLSGIDAWRQKWFGSTNNGGAGADLSDYAGDGVKNLAKYALGLEPTKPASYGLPSSSRTNGFLSLTFNRKKDANDITYRVEAASDLKTNWSEIWNSSTNSYPGGTNALFPQTVQDAIPAADAPGGRRFMRLKVTRP